MSATACAGRMSLIVKNLRALLARSSVYRVHIRNFYLRPTCLATTKVEMPSLSPTMETGTIVKWHKKEGDAIAPGDMLCDIQTDKAIVGMEYDEEGILAKIIKPDNSADISVGTLIALVVDEGDDWQNVQVPAGAEAAPKSSAPASPLPAVAPLPPPAAPAAAAATGMTSVIKVEMPSLSPTMEKGTIIKWNKKEGDVIAPGDILCDIQTDKAVVGMEYDDEGILAKILKPDNSVDVTVGSLIALIVPEGEDWQNVQVPVESGAASVLALQETGGAAPVVPAVQATASPVKSVVEEYLPGIGPSVKKLLHEYNITARSVPGTGPKGNLLKGDLLDYIKSKGLHKVDQTLSTPAPTPPTQAAPPQPTLTATPASQGEPYIDIPLTNMRKVIAKRLTQSKTTVPHAYATIDCSMQTVTNTRKRFIEQGTKVSMNDFIIKAAGYALQRCPKVNAINEGEVAQSVASVDISVAVATDGGLITPIVQNVPGLGVAQISETVKTLAQKARAGKLKPHEFQGGTFSISNLGMFGIKEFSAVINPPQVAILAIGATRLTVGTENSILDPKMAVTLSYDSRVMDEQDATQFLEIFRLAMENPDLLVEGVSSPRNADFAVGTAV